MLTQDSDARKRLPMFRGLLVYFPDALAAVAGHSFENNEKHNPGEPVHWAREKSTDQEDTVIRHMTDLAGMPTLTHENAAERLYAMKATAWRALAQLQLEIEAQEALNTPYPIPPVPPAKASDPATVTVQRDPGDEDDDRRADGPLWAGELGVYGFRCGCGEVFVSPKGLAAHREGCKR